MIKIANIFSNTFPPLNFLRENFQSADATKGNDFHGLVLTVDSQKFSRKASIFIKVCAHLHDLQVLRNVLGSFLAKCGNLQRESLVRAQTDHENVSGMLENSPFLLIFVT